MTSKRKLDVSIIGRQIFQGYSGNFKKGVEEITIKLKKELRNLLKEKRPAIQRIIREAIIHPDGTVQYFRTPQEFKLSERSLETEVTLTMIQMIINELCKDLRKDYNIDKRNLTQREVKIQRPAEVPLNNPYGYKKRYKKSPKKTKKSPKRTKKNN